MVTRTGSKQDGTRVWTSETPPPSAIRADHGLGQHPEIFRAFGRTDGLGRTPEIFRSCVTTTPEPHLAGEFPMSCRACHLEADS